MFEQAFAAYTDSKFCIGLNSGTSADQVALKAVIEPGDEIITTANTFIATTEAITAAGGKPVFVDIEEESYNIDPQKIEAAITKNTRAIMPVHLFGQPADMDKILELAKDNNLYVIEDAAQAHGAEYKGHYSKSEELISTSSSQWKKCGSIGDAAAFSFYPGKNLGAYGEAGAITTNNPEIDKFVRMYRDHGSSEKYIHEFEGHNMRMAAFQGGVLNVKLKYLDQWTSMRRKNANYYDQLFSGVEAVIAPREMDYAKHVYHLYVVRVKQREELQTFLKENNIYTGFHYKYPLHLQKAYQYLGYKKGDLPVTEKAMQEIISLPMYPELEQSEIEYVVEMIKKFIKAS
ncbi:aminotransferase class I/II-fold pyridoxal phosphate-dependent enzyme [candidate division KSB1 bacterium]|nr:aminotransferase class I/II-fold pyridoxal phosphate-dependent enzyme [candidate division KSB1 bacterium]